MTRLWSLCGRPLAAWCLLLFTCASARAIPAFPGAEGFGAKATGGRGGDVYVVTHLNDTGPGSFREAVSQPNRTVVFAVGGVIPVSSRIVVAANVTIAGQTAPGEGITLYGNGLSYSNANNSITRYLRIRMGVGGDSGKDALTIAEGHDMIFDHVSVSWGRDETFSISGDVRNVTIQDSIIAQGLQTHSAGGLIQTDGGVSILRTLYIDNHTRNPKVKGVNDFVNNVVYNWGGGGGYILGDSAGPSYANIVNNLFIHGPQTTVPAFSRGNLNFHVYADNNVQDTNRNGVLDGTVVPPEEYTTVDFQAERYPYPAVSYLLSPEQAYEHVVAHAGASRARDRVDRHLIESLRSLGTAGEIISNENDAPMFGAGPVAGGSAPADRDRDGMPDRWELARGLDPDVPDHNGDADGDGYTNLEDYLNALVGAGVQRVAVTHVAPDTGASAADGVTVERRLIVHGTAAPGATVSIRRVGVGAIGTTVAGADGAWSFDYRGTELPEGLHAFVATATETSGWTSPPSRGLLVVVDSVAPAAAEVTSVSRTDAVEVRGSSELGASVTVALEGAGVIGTAAADAMGQWVVRNVDLTLGAGLNVFSAVASDLAGNQGAASEPYRIDASLTPPTLTGISDDAGVAADDRVTNDATLLLRGTAGANAAVSLTRVGTGYVGTAQAGADGAWTFDYTATTLPAGTHAFIATSGSGDAFSLASTPAEITVDLAAPRVATILRHVPAASATVAGDVVYRVTFSEDVVGVDLADFTLTLAGASASLATVAPLSASIYDVAVNGLSGEGTVRLDLRASGTGIEDDAGNFIQSGYTAGQSYTVRLPGSGVWIASDSGEWADAANWEAQAVASGVGATADFSVVEVEEDLVVHLSSARTLGHLIFGDADPATVAGWRLEGADPLTLDVSQGAPSITVNPLGTGVAATLALPLSSSAGLAKLGTGVAVLTQPNAVAGPLSVGRGQLRLAAGASLEATTASISNGGSQLQVAGGSFRATGLTTITAGGSSGVQVSAGEAALDGGIVSTNARDALVKVTGGRLTTPSIDFPRSNDGSINFGVGFVVQGGEAHVGTIGLGTANSWGTMSVEGGSLVVTGPVWVGRQVTAGRGGRIRITGGVLSILDTVDGLVLARNPGTQPNNVASADFTGGVSTIGRVILGYDATSTAGSATVNLNGGALYLGAGGLVSRGAGAFVANVNLIRGVLGAQASWSTDVTLNLPAGNDLEIRAADTLSEPQDITLNGRLTGAGGFRKTGAGTLILRGDTAFTGSVVLEAGGLRALGERPLGGGLVLHGDTQLQFGVGFTGGSDQLMLNGPLARAGSGAIQLHLIPGELFAIGQTFTLASFSGTTLTPSDFHITGLPAGTMGVVTIENDRLVVTIYGPPELAEGQSATGRVGDAFSYTVDATGPVSQFTAQGLPEGLTLDPMQGTLSGVPLAAGTFAVTVEAANAAGRTSTIVTLMIEKAVAQLHVTGWRLPYTGEPQPVVVTTVPAGLDVVITYDGQSTAPWLPREYDVSIRVDDADFAGEFTGTLAILPTVRSRYAPTLNGRVDGAVQVAEAENVTLNGGARVTGDLLLPGTPAIWRNGAPSFAGTRDGDGAVTPTHHVVTLNGGSQLRHVVQRVDAYAAKVVAPPAAPIGTRNVTLRRQDQSAGDFATLRNLTLQNGAGAHAIPPGAYGEFVAQARTAFVLGTAGATEPAVYELQRLAIHDTAELRVVGPVILRLGQGFTTAGALGTAEHPEWLVVELATGGLTLDTGAEMNAEITAPRGVVILNEGAVLTGRVNAERVTLNGNSAVQE